MDALNKVKTNFFYVKTGNPKYKTQNKGENKHSVTLIS